MFRLSFIRGFMEFDMPRRVLMACSNDWTSPFQVGSHHLARGLVRTGYEVAFVSDPISPFHLARGWSRDLRRRFGIYQAGGRTDLDSKLWAYVPGSLLTPHNKPLLRAEWVARSWQHWTWPNPVRLARQHGFDPVDVLYIDSIEQSFWLKAISYQHSVYRVADYNPHFEKYTPAARRLEQELAQGVDLVVYPSAKLRSYAEELGARRCRLLSNGVDFPHYADNPQPQPAEYQTLRGPIAVYFGVIPSWFHFDWIRQAAVALPQMHFVLIGPDELARHRLAGLANVHVLGLRPYAELPGYLQHAHIGLMPFDVVSNPRGVEVLQPQKLYAYLASGLPVVSCAWENLLSLNAPIRMCATAAEFIVGLQQGARDPGDRDAYRRYAAGHDWQQQVHALLEMLETLPQPCRDVA